MRSMFERRGWSIGSSVLFGVACLLIGSRLKTYGLDLFLAVPFITGFVGAWVDALECRRSFGECCTSALIPLGLASVLFLLLGMEGLVCIAMAAVIGVPLAILGAGLAFLVQRHRAAPAATLTMILLAPLAMIVGPHGPGHDIDTATTSIVINAPPRIVWSYIQSFREIGPPDNLLFRAGVAYPVATRTAGVGVGATRECILSTGVMTERVTVWKPERQLTFEVLNTPVAMRELSPWPNLDLPHLHGFYLSKQGEFRLTPVSGDKTLLEGQSWYQHGLAPVAYWNLWTRYIVHSVHKRVLNHIKDLAEAEATQTQLAVRR